MGTAMHADFDGLESEGATRRDTGPGKEAESVRGTSRLPRLAAGVLTLLTLTACSSWRNPPPKDPDALADYKEANDPYEPLNRKMYSLNMWAYHHALRPVGKAWAWVVPKFARDAISNLSETWNEPVAFFSDVGAGKSRRAGDSFMRFAINMTAGVGGLIDVATPVGYPQEDGNPGMTLATWGVPSGPYLFLPGMGPGTVRDAAADGIISIGLAPIDYVPKGYGLLTFNWAYNIAGRLNGYADAIDQIDNVERDALDPYAFIRSAWQQQQAVKIEAFRNDNRATVPDWYN
ncbi:lipoprotein [Acidomonas methanolica NBRC 104435]|uniref:Lipoprotein n=2 Tax=Acidomonas methanolica TaxID=437 RepID=A0A023D1I0_ACIMT|nr:lipoprotein [Acidomonas methanolica NBRC 104435]GEK98534.1 hypothetical protein AME01nite_10330 [Acidomonas methanolica NBRC 104435]